MGFIDEKQGIPERLTIVTKVTQLRDPGCSFAKPCPARQPTTPAVLLWERAPCGDTGNLTFTSS